MKGIGNERPTPIEFILFLSNGCGLTFARSNGLCKGEENGTRAQQYLASTEKHAVLLLLIFVKKGKKTLGICLYYFFVSNSNGRKRYSCLKKQKYAG